ncbi:matrixin family metalloprotease [Armatimonas sp.]|uniref:matrixin family metalloprotease n=1 Tax=Armatimonas sp. TaxID=1872638 RepID=UPI00375326A7
MKRHFQRHFLGSLALLSVLMGCAGSSSTPPPTTPDYLSELNLSLRWSSSKTANPLKVFIGLDGTTDRSTELMAAANAWSIGTSNLVRFTQTTDASEADITVAFSETVNSADGGVGITKVRFFDSPSNPTTDGIIQKSDITIRQGVSSALLLPVAEHQFGHSLGIVGRNLGDNGHSAFEGDVMHEVIKTSSALSSRDSATLIQLYARTRAH